MMLARRNPFDSSPNAMEKRAAAISRSNISVDRTGAIRHKEYQEGCPDHLISFVAYPKRSISASP
jgi:hypothetical protein